MGTNVTIKSYTKERQKEILDGLVKSMQRVGQIVENQAKENVNNARGSNRHPWVQSGQLQSSIIHKTEKSGNSIVELIGTNVRHGMYLEFGTIKMPPYPWLFPAVESKREEIVQLLGNKVGVGLQTTIGEYGVSEETQTINTLKL